MKEGAFALIDCLGFKGIWERGDDPILRETLLLEKLRSILNRIQLQLFAGLPYHLLRRNVILTASLLSDSVAISLRYEDEKSKVETNKQKAKKIRERREKSYLVWLICASTIRVLDLYLKGEPALVLRGCITYGKHEHDATKTGSFLVGPAVVNAEENMEVSQGAFVWLLPEAAELYRYAVTAQRKTIRLLYKRNDKPELLDGSKKSLREPLMVDPYDMPLKRGGRLRCLVVNPLAFHETKEDRQEVFCAYEKALSGNRLDVWLKQQYTMEFLREADEARARHLKDYDKFIDDLEKS